MKIRYSRLGRIFGPDSFASSQSPITYTSNPVVIQMQNSIFRIYFNSRDSQNRSNVWSVDFDFESLKVIQNSLRVQIEIGINTPKYCRAGISLGSDFSLDNQRYIGFMGWYLPDRAHWMGEIGRLEIDEAYNLELIDGSPWIGISKEDPISLSYPAIHQTADGLDVWYGSTHTWDAGNGEMLHLLERRRVTHEFGTEKIAGILPFELGIAQAFSRPAILNTDWGTLFSYSVRGNTDKYRIAFRSLNATYKSIQFGEPVSFLPSTEEWESEMVEYPYLVTYKGEVYMFYNGNRFGKSGVGLARIYISGN